VGSSVSIGAPPATINNFDGVGNGFTGPSGTFTVNAAPPDTNGAVGPNHFVEVVNTSLAVFSKSGTPLLGPVAINTVWSGFGGRCQIDNDGDPTVLYDQMADRWVVTQFAVTNANPYLMCVAVSTSGDPTGSYYRYSFPYGTNLPDYPKLAVWPDAYYLTVNLFANGQTFVGAAAAALDRTSMLAGLPATQQLFQTSSGGLLPSTLDGSRLPPAGAPDHMLALGGNNASLLAWNFHVDWTTPANSSFSGPVVIPVAAFSPVCGGGTCIPQSGTIQQLDSLADRLMYRLAYRNFGDHESLVANHSVVAGGSSGVRWYELRMSNAYPALYQQGTYAPDGDYRWMGSVAMDQVGDIAMGFSKSSATSHPAIAYTTRLASDPAGAMTQGEGIVVAGNGSQTGNNLSRWGDYSSLAVDPADDCTFWYANEYIPADGAFNWRTRVASFQLSACTSTPSDFSISANPTTVSAVQGGSASTSIVTAVTSGTAQTVNLSAGGLPSGATATFAPTSVTAGNTSTLTLTADVATAAGSYSITVSGAGTTVTHATQVTFNVTAPPADDFSISASPGSVSAQQGSGATTTISTTLTSGSAQSIQLSAGGLPSGSGASFNPATINSGDSSTLALTAGTATPVGTYSVLVTATGTRATHSATVSFTVTAPPPPDDFSINANPTSVVVAEGSSANTSIVTTATSGNPVTVNLTAGGLPSGVLASFNPTSVTSGGTSTLTLTAGSSAPAGSYTVTVIGTSPTNTHSTAVGLTVASAGNPIVNGRFETGDLSAWTRAGSTSISTTAHSGGYAAMVGAGSPTNGDSSVAQSFVAPAGGGVLSFFYQVRCPDTVTYDWATATLKDGILGTTSVVLPKTCTNSTAWESVTATLTGGHTYTLTLISHDDNYPGDPTLTLYDDVAVGPPPPPPPPGITNGGFETGDLGGWTTSGAVGVSTTAHSGSFSAMVGRTAPTAGDSTLQQSFTAGTGSSKLSLYYANKCPDTVTYDWVTVTLTDTTTGTTVTLVPRTCAVKGSWTNVTASVVPGHTYTLTLVSHDDNYLGDPTYTLFDDIALS